MKHSTTIIATLTWLASAMLAGYIFSRLPLSDFLIAIASLQLTDWAVWISLNLIVLVLLATRWRILTRALGLGISLLQILGVRQAGALISFVTPGPQFGGEPLQVLWLWRRYRVPGPTALLAVGLDRFFELLVNFSVLLVAALLLLGSGATPGMDWSLLSVGLFGIMLLMVGAVSVLVVRPMWLRRFVRNQVGHWQQHPRLKRLGEHRAEISQQLHRLTADRRSALGFAMLASCLAWAGMIVEFWFLLGLAQVPFDVTDFILLFTVMRLAFLLPLPGGIGSLEAGLFWSFQALGLPLSMAASTVVLMRARDLSLLLSGAFVLPTLNSRSID